MTNPIGNPEAQIMLVGEAPGKEEEKEGVPFIGTSGRLMAQFLAAEGAPVMRPSDHAEPPEMAYVWENSHLFLTNVSRTRPPDNKIDKFFANKTEAKKEGLVEIMGRYPRQAIKDGMVKLYEEIKRVNPNVIVAAGGTSLWALTGRTGITSWRGSTLESIEIGGHRYKVIPVVHPALILRKWEWKNLFTHDIRERVLPQRHTAEVPQPNYDFIHRPTFDEASRVLNSTLNFLDQQQLRIASDIETRWGQIACIGLAFSDIHAICIPIMTTEPPDYSYWNLEEEVYLVWLLKQIHEHPNALIVGQNFNFDREHLAKFWGINSRLYMDTMTAHHTCWPAMKKSLEFLSSLYCEYHCYWKDESSEWPKHLGEEQLWIYNCKDCVVTYEISCVLEGLVETMNLREQYNFQMKMEDHVFRSWLRGIRYDNERRRQLGVELMQKMQEYRSWFIYMLNGEEKLNPKSKAYWFDSDSQLKQLFYKELRIKPVLKDGRPTTNKEALKIIAKREPLVAPICYALIEYNSLRTYYQTFINVPLDPHDGRFRCTLDVNGTETFRFSSRRDGFGVGANVQNIPEGEEED